ncbi:hypothetical protein [Sphingomonas sp.]|jgi:hypothetical protein|uniref:hypothetical protein n=1 Tax=Sphingomonas sp. TaxID=28214 RepID=UPI002E351EDB|nr:hypothetical protein [Sphingomonas sp.]HEX4692920.1 hypothetical protein [Sphingomonas sp.]
MLRKIGWGLLASSLLGAGGPPTAAGAAERPRPLIVLRPSTGACLLTWDGAAIDTRDIRRRARALPRPRKVTLTIVGNAPYRCIGAVIYMLQGARAEVTFDPPLPLTAVRITVEPGACRPTIDGVAYSLDAFGERAKALRQQEVHFQPSADASYSCVDAVLARIREAGIYKLGFIGNEYVPETRK